METKKSVFYKIALFIIFVLFQGKSTFAIKPKSSEPPLADFLSISFILILVISIILVFIGALIVVSKINKDLARKKRKSLFTKLELVDKFTKKECVTTEIRNRFSKVKGKLISVEIDNNKKFFINWRMVLEDLSKFDKELSLIMRDINNQIYLSKKAKRSIVGVDEKIRFLIDEISKKISHEDVAIKTKTNFENLRIGYESILKTVDSPTGKNWIEIFEKYKILCSLACNTLSDIENNISFAKLAKENGPKLLKSIPPKIDSMLETYHKDTKIVEILCTARFQYQIIRKDESCMAEPKDWVTIYTKLLKIETDINSIIKNDPISNVH